MNDKKQPVDGIGGDDDEDDYDDDDWWLASWSTTMIHEDKEH